MNIYQVTEFYMDKEKTKCPLTEALVKSGYQQSRGGYIQYAQEQNETVDYKEAMPGQWWHLIKAYCASKKPDEKFTKRVQCGELIFWMAEVSECISRLELEELFDKVVRDEMNRREGNILIRKTCFDKIVEKVEKTVPDKHK